MAALQPCLEHGQLNSKRVSRTTKRFSGRYQNLQLVSLMGSSSRSSELGPALQPEQSGRSSQTAAPAHTPKGNKTKAKGAKKGANPLKAKLLAQKGTLAKSGPAQAPEPVRVEEAAPILTLFYASASAQHAALARMEAFYESAATSRRYLTLAEAERERLCRNYEAFNLPMSSLAVWFASLLDAESVQWTAAVNEQEKQLLLLLMELGVIPSPDPEVHDESTEESAVELAPAADTEGSATMADASKQELPDPLRRAGSDRQDQSDGRVSPQEGNKSSSAFTYLISCLSSRSQNLSHERLHALYHLSSAYRASVGDCYSQLSRKARKAVETDLNLRGYGEQVWEDEWQAYVVDGDTDLGGGVAKGENGELRVRLVGDAKAASAQEGLVMSL